MKKVAVFVDWEAVRKGVFEKSSFKIDYNKVDNVIKFVEAFIKKDEEEIYRTFVYLCEPYKGEAGGVNYSQSATTKAGMSFIEKLQVKDLIAVRKGTIAYRGKDDKGKPIFMQKQVDMLLGLDIAHIAYNRLADRALILSFDTDMVPAMKVARINGLQVIWGYCPDIIIDRQDMPSHLLKKHSDLIRGVDFSSIFTPPTVCP